nr:hypothetical protein [Tanacetum cinerariifolium]
MKQVQGGAVTETSHEPGSNKRLSSVVVARLMGLESLTDFSIEVETSKIMPPLNDHPSLILSRNGDEYKQNHASVSPRVYLKIKLASQQQEDNDESTKKPLFMILETMQTTRRVFENKEQSLDSQKSDQSGSPTVKKTISPKRSEPMNQATRPTKMATETMMMTGGEIGIWVTLIPHFRIKPPGLQNVFPNLYLVRMLAASYRSFKIVFNMRIDADLFKVAVMKLLSQRQLKRKPMRELQEPPGET